MNLCRLFFLFAFIGTLVVPSLLPAAQELPNIVLILADDLGYGDPGCYGGQIKTPATDKLASEGLRFTDAHSTSATCTPSRFGLLTGHYPWRRQGTGILPGNAALIVPTDWQTLPSMLKDAGYRTGVVGKWHLGLGGKGGPDWNGEIKPGPLEIGFDYAFLMPATADRVPCVYVENRRVVGLNPADPVQVSFGEPLAGVPTGKANPEKLKLHPSHGHDQAIVNGISRIGYMKGGTSALWKDEDMADRFVTAATNFIATSKGRPFFLYFATHDPHVPRVPHPRFAGKSGMGPRGDAIVQFDWCVGQITEALKRSGLADNTLIILTSDNGPVLDDGYKDRAVELLGSHKPAGPWRGGKYSSFEGGTRVPFIVRWPARVRPGVSDALVSQVDLLASLAQLTGQTVQTNTARDSVSVLPALLGESKQGRSALVEHAGGLSLRKGNDKYIEPRRGPKVNANTGTEMGADPAGQLYDLKSDPGERNNLLESDRETATRMAEELEAIRDLERRPPGKLPANER